MSGDELDRLDPAALDDFALAEAHGSAAALGEDARTARFAAVLAARAPSALARVDRPALFAALVRQALADDDPDLALARIDRAEEVDGELAGGRDRRRYETWKAELFARIGRPDASALIYRELLDADPDPELALDAAETFADNGHDEQSRVFARLARKLAIRYGRGEIATLADRLL